MGTTQKAYIPTHPGALGVIKHEQLRIPVEEGRFGYFAANDFAALANKYPVMRLGGGYVRPIQAAVAATSGSLSGWSWTTNANSGITMIVDAVGTKITSSAGNGDYGILTFDEVWTVATDKVVKKMIQIKCDDTDLTNLAVGIGTQTGDPITPGTHNIMFTKAAGAAAPWVGNVRGTGANSASSNLTASADDTFLDLYFEFMKGSSAALSWGRFGIAVHGSDAVTWTNFSSAQKTQLATITGSFKFFVGWKTGSAVARNLWIKNMRGECDS